MTGLEAARLETQESEGQLKDELTKRDMMRREMSTMPATLALDADTLPGGATNQQVAQAEARLAELRLLYTEQYPEVVNARNLIAALKAAPPPETPAAMPKSARTHHAQPGVRADAHATIRAGNGDRLAATPDRRRHQGT